MPSVKSGSSFTVNKHVIALTENYFFQETMLFKLKMGGGEDGCRDQ